MTNISAIWVHSTKDNSKAHFFDTANPSGIFFSLRIKTFTYFFFYLFVIKVTERVGEAFKDGMKLKK